MASADMKPPDAPAYSTPIAIYGTRLCAFAHSAVTRLVRALDGAEGPAAIAEVRRRGRAKPVGTGR